MRYPTAIIACGILLVCGKLNRIIIGGNVQGEVGLEYNLLLQVGAHPADTGPLAEGGAAIRLAY